MERISFIVGVFIVLIPILGIPNSWKEYLLLVLGIILILTSARIMLKNNREGKNKGGI